MNIPIIMISGNLTKGKIFKLKKLGVKQFLSKPFNIVRLRETISRFAEN